MKDENDPAVMAKAKACKEFLETMGEMMTRLEITPPLAVRLFGMFTKRLVDIAVSEGADDTEMTMRAMDDFLQGLGMQTSVKEVKGEQAQQMMAEFERNDHPVQ